eukprot:547226-Prorocentrum_minimum.AAC.7
MNASDWHYSFLYKDLLLPRLAIGSFVHALANDLREAAMGAGRYKLGVFGGHDTTLAPLIGLLTGAR